MGARDVMDVDLYEEEYDAEERLDKVCNRCGAAGLHWDDPQGRAWVLAEPNGNRHVCPPTDDGFEVLM